jgi:hypothetical protein
MSGERQFDIHCGLIFMIDASSQISQVSLFLRGESHGAFIEVLDSSQENSAEIYLGEELIIFDQSARKV